MLAGSRVRPERQVSGELRAHKQPDIDASANVGVTELFQGCPVPRDFDASLFQGGNVAIVVRQAEIES